MRVEPSRDRSTSLCIKHVAPEHDEEDLKQYFPSCARVNLIRGSRGAPSEKPDGAEDEIRRLFNAYRSFQRTTVIAKPKLVSGRVEAIAVFEDEREARSAIDELSGRIGLIGAGKIRMSLMMQTKPTKATVHRDEYVVEMARLSPAIVEEDILNELKRHPVVDSITNVFIFRKKLAEESGEQKNDMGKRALQDDLIKLMSLFNSRTLFRSEPEISINPATADGRVTAHVLFDNPDDVIQAMKLYQNPANPEVLRFGRHKLHLAPCNEYVIVLNPALANAIRPRIQKVLEMIRQMCLPNVTAQMKEKGEGVKKNTRIYIQGTDNLQIAKVRDVFSRLMKGLEFRFHDPSWVRTCTRAISICYHMLSCFAQVSVIFDAKGKNFLTSLQERTKTYIWWNWSSTFLRIFGEDDASNEVYKEIDTFIQNATVNRRHPITVNIPQGNSNLYYSK